MASDSRSHSRDGAQERIWDHYQNEGIANFDDAVPRLRFLFDRARRGSTGQQLNVLNIGIGNGWLERRCAQEGWQVASIDPNERAVAKLRADGIDAQVGSITALPQAASSLDIVFCSEVLEHLVDADLMDGLAEVSRVLRPGGLLIGTVPYREDLAAATVVCPKCGEHFHRWGHAQSFDRGRLAGLLVDAAFHVDRLGPRAFADAAKPGVAAIAKHMIRIPLARLGSRLIYANLFFEASKRGARTGS